MRSREGKEGQEVLMGPGFLPPSWDLGSLIWGGESWEEEPCLPPSYLWLLREELRIRCRGREECQGCLFLPLLHVFKMCCKGLRLRRKELRGSLRLFQVQKDLGRLSVLTIQPCFSHQPTAFYFKGLGRCLGVILKFMLTTTVKIAAFTDMCLHLVSRKCSVWKITIS